MNPREFEPTGADDPALAAEFALGLLHGDERAVAERRVEEDPAFARAVDFWSTRLAPLADDIPPEPVAAHVWARVQHELGALEGGRSDAAVASERTGLWNSLPFWRALGLAGSALAAACLTLLLLAPPAAPPSLVATLTTTEGASVFMAAVDPRTGRVMLIPAADTPAPPEHTHELWLVTADGVPKSLGTFVAKGDVTMKMPDAMMPDAGVQAVLAVSVEPMGGSKTGVPTGPVVARGKMQAL